MPDLSDLVQKLKSLSDILFIAAAVVAVIYVLVYMFGGARQFISERAARFAGLADEFRFILIAADFLKNPGDAKLCVKLLRIGRKLFTPRTCTGWLNVWTR